MSASDVLGAARSTMLVLVVIEELADSRDGVLTLDEAVRGGLTRRQVCHRVRIGQWAKLYPGSTWSAGVSLTSRYRRVHSVALTK